MALLSLLSPGEAANAGDLIYELILSNWGNWGAKRDLTNGSIVFPPIAGNGIPLASDPSLPSVFGMAIAPRSDVDRVIVRYNTHRPDTLPSTFFFNDGGILESETKVSVDAPFVGQLTGPIVLRADPTHWFADSYVPANVAAPPALPAFGTAFDRFVNPELRLLLYVSPKIVLPARGRVPFYNELTRAFLSTETGTEVLLRVVPIMGRRRARVSFAVSGGTGPGSNVTVRVSGTFTGVTSTGGAVPNVRVQEVPLAGPTVIDANTGGVATFTLEDPESSFLLLKATPSVANVTIRAAVEARD